MMPEHGFDGDDPDDLEDDAREGNDYAGMFRGSDDEDE